MGLSVEAEADQGTEGMSNEHQGMTRDKGVGSLIAGRPGSTYCRITRPTCRVTRYGCEMNYPIRIMRDGLSEYAK